MCDCFSRVFGVSWSPAAHSAAETHGAESRVSKTRQPAPPAESQRNDHPAGPQTATGQPLPLPLEEAADPGRAAQKEKLHAELKRVLQKKGTGQPSSREAEEEHQAPGGVEAQPRKMEKTMEASELLEVIVETEAEAGVSGMSVAGGGKQGLFVKDVLKGSPAARALSLREGDQLLSARVYFDNMKYEDALQILKSAEPYKVSFCLKRTVPGTDVTRGPGAPTFEVRGPKAKMAKLSIQSLTSLKKQPPPPPPKMAEKGLAKDLQETEARGSQKLVGGKPEAAPVGVEFSLPNFAKLRKARSAGEVAAAAPPRPALSPLLSSLETRRRRLKLPRLKVKEALAARAAGAAGRLEGAPPKAAPEQKATAQAGAGRKAARFITIPFSKGKKPKEEAAGFQAPQVELDFPVPKVGPGGEPPKARADPAGTAGGITTPGLLPKVEMALPKGSPAGPEAPAQGSPARLRLPAAEVEAPKVDVDLSLPRLEGAPPEVAPRGEGFQIRVPKWGVSTEETEAKLGPLDVILGKGGGKAEGPEEKAAMPSLELGLPSLDVEIPLPRGKAPVEVPKPKMEIPEVSIMLPTVSLPKLGSKPREEEEEARRVPQVELCVGKRESPEAKAKSRVAGFGFSLMERKSESREAAAGPAESQAKPLGLKVPSLDISVPKVTDVQLPKPWGELEALAPLAKAEEVLEGPRFKFQVPHVSLSKSSTPAQATPSPPRVPKKPEGEAGAKVGVPALDLALPAVKSLDMQLPKGHVPKPELALSVDRPEVEVALPAPRLSFPPAAAPALELDLPKVAVELGLPKGGSECMQPEHPPRDHEVKFTVPALETLSRDLDVEISIPPCQEGPPERQPGEAGVLAAKMPQVELAFSKEEAAAGGPELEGSAKGGEATLPSVEVSAVKFPRVAVERGKSSEREPKLKSPRFALPKFGISGPKAWKVSAESFGPRGEGPEAADKGSKLKMPKFGISFPKSRAGAEGPKLAPSPNEEPAEGTAKLPSLVLLPKVDLEVPKLAVSLPMGKAESSDEEGGSSPGALPGTRRKMPKLSLPKFGGKDKEGGVELEVGEVRAKASKLKMALLSMAGRDLEGASPEVESKAKKGAGSPKERPRSPLVKMPQLELPKIGLPEAKAEEALLTGPESPSLKVKVPVLELAVPGATTEAEPMPRRPRAEGLEADLRSHEGAPKVPRAPSLGVSAPPVELDLCLPTLGAEAPVPHRVPGAEAEIRLPQVELPTFRREEATEPQLLGRGGEPGAAEAAEIRVPQVGLSMPKAQLPGVELPWTEWGGLPAGAEGRLRIPAVELPQFPTPKGGAPERKREGSPGGGKMLPTGKLQGEGGAELGLPQLELKVPKLGGSAERLAAKAGGREDRVPGPCPPSSLGLCRAEGEAGAAEEGAALSSSSKFKLKIPSVSIAKAGLEPRADTQPLCPSPEREGGVSFRMPQISLPEVGFSADQDSKREAKVEAGKRASAEGPEAEGFEARLKVPKIRIPALGVSVPKGGQDAAAAPEDPEGKKAAFRVPGLEFSAPTFKAHAEYQVEGAQLQRRGSQEREVAIGRVRAGSDGRKSPGGSGEAAYAEAGKKYKVRIPKFGLSLPKAGEGILGQEGDAKAKRPAFVLGRPRGSGAEGSSGLLEGDEEVGGKGVVGRFRLGLARLKMGGEINGELENGSGRMKLPKLGFSQGEGTPLHGEGAEAVRQNGTPDGKGKLGKIRRLPQVELSSPSATADPELSCKLVRAEEVGEAGGGPFAALWFRPPKITFSGFKKRNGESAPGAVVSSAARKEMASLEGGAAALKGGKPPKLKFPEVALSPESPTVLQITSKGRASPEEGRRGSHERLTVQLPRVGFSEEAGGSPPAAVGDKRGATAAV